MTDILKYGIVLLLCILLIKGTIDKEILLYFFTGLTLIISVLIIFTKTAIDLKLLTLMGGFILLTFPFSSAAGLLSVGIYSLWLSFPIAIDYLYKITSADSRFTLSRQAISDKTAYSLPIPS